MNVLTGLSFFLLYDFSDLQKRLLSFGCKMLKFSLNAFKAPSDVSFCLRMIHVFGGVSTCQVRYCREIKHWDREMCNCCKSQALGLRSVE